MPTEKDSRHFHHKNENTDTDSQTNDIIYYIGDRDHVIRPAEHFKENRNYISHLVNPFTIKNSKSNSTTENKQASDKVKVSI